MTREQPPVPLQDRFRQHEERIDGRDKVTGAARYTADERISGALHVRYVSSPIAHGTVRRVDAAPALAIPGVVAVLTGADAAGIRTGRRLQDWPVLAWDRVRFVGERVVAVAAETIDAAEDGIRAVDVEYDELPSVLDMDAALAPDAPILHPDAASYRFLGSARNVVSHPNVQGEVTLRKGVGEDDAAFDRLFESDGGGQVFEHVFETGRQHQAPLEPHAAVVWIDPDGTARIRSTNKSPFTLRGQMAAALDVPVDTIDIGSPTIGGDFGSKGLSLDEYPCLLLARATGRPVRAVAPYDEELTAYAPRHASRIRLRTLVDAEGRFVAVDGDVLYDGGAYAAAKPIPELIPPGGTDVLSAYDVPHVRLRIRSVYTNTVPGGHMRCPGEVQANFAGESHVEMIAAALGLDPLEFRERNVAREGSVSAAGERFRGSAGSTVLDLLSRHRPVPTRPGEGLGFALIARRQQDGQMSIDARLSDDGVVEMVTGLADQGAGAHTLMCRVAATVLSVPDDRVRVVRASTADAPRDIGVGASRMTYLAGHATVLAATQLRDALEEAAFEAHPDTGPLHLRDGRFVSADGTAIIEWDQVTALPGIRGRTFTGSFDSLWEHAPERSSDDGPDVADFSFGGLAVRVRVDRETGVWTILDAVFVADAGTVINPVAHGGQLEGGFAQGLGAVMMEELIVVDGQITSANLGDYRLPTATDVPALETLLVTDLPGPGAFGAKSAGELSPSAVAPAVANAIAQATGARVTRIPITAERLLRRLGDQDSGTSTTAMPVSHSAIGS